MVRVYAFAFVLLLVCIVNVDVDVEETDTDDGLNVTSELLGIPLELKFTVELKPLSAVMVIVVDVEPPWFTLTLLGLAAKAKLPV